MAFFTTKRKETGSYNTKRTKPCRSRRKGKIYNEKTKNGKLTVWGALYLYNNILAKKCHYWLTQISLCNIRTYCKIQ